MNTTTADTDSKAERTTIERDSKGRFLPGNTPENAFEEGNRPKNLCPQCGQARAKDLENDEIIRWYCARCDRKFTSLREW